MDENTHIEEGGISRRRALLALGGVAATALGAGAWKTLDGASEADAATGGPAAVAAGLVSCVLTPEQTEGPYYLEGDKVRRNITEGKAGVPLTLRLTVVDASTCKPIRGASVDVWHCDAGGVYSGVGDASGTTFLRGIQKTNAKGVATIQTLYPGWYRGRTVHIHVKVHVGGNVVHTGQLYFSDKVTDAVYKRSPYKQRGSRDQRNATDSVYRNGGKRSLLAVKKVGTGYVGTLVMGVSRS